MLVQRLPVTKARINLGADEFEDYLELRDPRVRAHIRESYRQYLAGKSRPAARLLAEIGKSKGRNRKRAPRRRT